MNKLTPEQIKAIEDIINSEDGSNRKAAREVLGSETKESNIRRWIKNGDIVKGDKHNITFPKILVIDIETAPMLSHLWGMYNQNISLDMIQKDWYVLAYAAKWYGEDQVFYQDKRDSFDDEDDVNLLREIWDLLDEADIVLGQNSIRFDTKKINSRFIQNRFQPPSSYRHIDTLQIAKKHFNFTSNKLEYMTDKLCTKYKKLSHGKYPGYKLWKECINGNIDAWEEMRDYNIHDILSTEELYEKLRPWMSNHPNVNTYHDSEDTLCVCGCNDWRHVGYYYTNLSKFDKFQCNSCGAEIRGRVNLLPKEKRQSLKANTFK